MRKWRLRRLAGLALAGIAAWASAPPARAESSLALTFAGGSMNRTSSNLMAGWRFALDRTIDVDGLGVWDYLGDGLAQDHLVGIWTDDGRILGSGHVKAGTAHPLEDGFRMACTPTITLAKGSTYRIAAFYDLDNTDALITVNAAATAAPGISFLGRAFELYSGGFAFPSGINDLAPAGNFGPMFRFRSSSAVPEPAGLLLLPIGGGGAFLLRRKFLARSL